MISHFQKLNIAGYGPWNTSSYSLRSSVCAKITGLLGDQIKTRLSLARLWLGWDKIWEWTIEHHNGKICSGEIVFWPLKGLKSAFKRFHSPTVHSPIIIMLYMHWWRNNKSFKKQKTKTKLVDLNYSPRHKRFNMECFSFLLQLSLFWWLFLLELVYLQTKSLSFLKSSRFSFCIAAIKYVRPMVSAPIKNLYCNHFSNFTGVPQLKKSRAMLKWIAIFYKWYQNFSKRN